MSLKMQTLKLDPPTDMEFAGDGRAPMTAWNGPHEAMASVQLAGVGQGFHLACERHKKPRFAYRDGRHVNDRLQVTLDDDGEVLVRITTGLGKYERVRELSLSELENLVRNYCLEPV